MKKSVFSGLLAALVAITMVSCKSNIPKEAKYIPRDASFVVALDPQQLKDKLQKGGISLDTLLNRVFKNDSMDAKDKAMIANLKDSAGINWNDKLFLFAQQKTNADNSQSGFFSVMGGLKDEALLEAFLNKQEMMKGKTVTKEKDYSYVTPREGAMIAWNSEEVIVTMYQHTMKPVYDTVAMSFKQPVDSNKQGAVKTEVGKFFTQKTTESLADVAIFTTMFKEKADGYAFTSGNSSVAALTTILPIQPPKLEAMLKDNYMASTLDFADGKIVAKSTFYANELLGNVLKKYAGPTVDLSLIENYPSQHINGIVMAAFNPEIFGGILQQLEVEGLVNTFLEKSGLTAQDVYKSLKGDIAVVVSDIDFSSPDPLAKTNEKSMTRKKTLGKMLLFAPIGDKAGFAKVMDKGVEHGLFVKQNGVYKAGGLLSFMGMYVMADGKNFVVASDSLTYVQYVSRAGKATINKEALDRFKGKSTVFYVDIAATLNGFSKDPSANYDHSLQTAKTTFKDVIATSDNFDGKKLNADFEIRMQNEKQNSLVTLTSLLTDIAVDMRVQAKREREMETRMFPGGIPAIIRTN